MPQNARNSTPSTSHVYIRLLAQLSTSSATAFQFLDAFFISTSPFHSLGAAFTTFSGHFNAGFCILKYQAINDHSQSLFATHPTAMCVAVASSVVYFLAYGYMLRFSLHRFASLAHHVLVSSGYIAVASIAAVTLPHTVSPLVYAIFRLLAATGLLYLLYRKLVAEEDEVEFWIRRFLRGNFLG